MKNVSDKICRENNNTYFILFFTLSFFYFAIFEALTAFLSKVEVLLKPKPCRLVNIYRRFGISLCLFMFMFMVKYSRTAFSSLVALFHPKNKMNFVSNLLSTTLQFFFCLCFTNFRLNGYVYCALVHIRIYKIYECIQP